MNDFYLGIAVGMSPMAALGLCFLFYSMLSNLHEKKIGAPGFIKPIFRKKFDAYDPSKDETKRMLGIEEDLFYEDPRKDRGAEL